MANRQNNNRVNRRNGRGNAWRQEYVDYVAELFSVRRRKLGYANECQNSTQRNHQHRVGDNSRRISTKAGDISLTESFPLLLNVMRTVAALQKEHSTCFRKQCVIAHREHATISTRREPNGLEERHFLFREMLYAYCHTEMVRIMNKQQSLAGNERLEGVRNNGDRECA